MEKQYHFISGLPRSGSTLLSSILLQNPRFHASITDPVCTFHMGVIETIGNQVGMKSEVPIERRENVLRGIMDSYYQNINKEVIFNTNRSWTTLTPQVKQLYPNSKMILCVRDINWILDSFEVAHRKNPLQNNTATGGHGTTVYHRVESLMGDQGIVSGPYTGVKQAITSNEKDILMLVEYDDLCKNPESIMKGIYSFIGEEYYEHDFDNVERAWNSYDDEIGIPLHTVKKKVEYTPRNFILPPDILQKYHGMEVWRQM